MLPRQECERVVPPAVEAVSDGVYAYLQLDGQWGLNNCGFLVGRTATMLIDTCYTERRTRALLDAVRRVSKKPVATAVNTHEHGDHTWGNYLLPRSTTIIGHERCREAMMAAGFAAKGVFPGVDWGEIVLRPPEVTFRDRATLHLDDVEIHSWHVGAAHTTSDIVLWVPERKVLFAGDLVFNGGTPFVLMGSVSGALTALEQLKALGPEVIVPGHGPVAGPEVLDGQIAYLRFVQRIADRALADGIGALEAARDVELGPFASLHDPERLVGNLARAIAECRGAPPGAPIDVPAALEEMIRYNGGRPLNCLA